MSDPIFPVAFPPHGRLYFSGEPEPGSVAWVAVAETYEPADDVATQGAAR